MKTSPKVYRCPVRGLLLESGDLFEAVKAEIEAKGLEGQARIDFIEDRDQCDQMAKYVRFECEEVIIPSEKTVEDMPKNRYGNVFPQGVARNILVRCPIHGEKILQKPDGHHITEKR
jgi:hypothetical protein